MKFLSPFPFPTLSHKSKQNKYNKKLLTFSRVLCWHPVRNLDWSLSSHWRFHVLARQGTCDTALNQSLPTYALASQVTSDKPLWVWWRAYVVETILELWAEWIYRRTWINVCLPPVPRIGFSILYHSLSLWVAMSFTFKVPSNNWKKWFLRLASWSLNSTLYIYVIYIYMCQKAGFRCSHNTLFINVWKFNFF